MQHQNPHPQFDEKAGHQAAADLSFSTALSQMLASGGQQPQQVPEQPPETPEEQAPEETPAKLDTKMAEMELSMNEKLDEMRKELKAENEKGIESLKNEIKLALTEEDSNEQTEA